MRTVAVKRPRDGNNRASTATMVGELIAAAYLESLVGQ